MLLHLNKAHPAVVPPPQRRQRALDLKLYHTSYSPDGASFDFWLLAALKKHLEGSHLSCEEEMISRTTWRILPRRARKTCSALEALYRTWRKLRGKMRNRNKYSFWAIFLVVFYFDTLSVCKDTSRRHYFPNAVHTVTITQPQQSVYQCYYGHYVSCQSILMCVR
jgi:hypothetical protein